MRYMNYTLCVAATCVWDFFFGGGHRPRMGSRILEYEMALVRWDGVSLGLFIRGWFALCIYAKAGS